MWEVAKPGSVASTLLSVEKSTEGSPRTTFGHATESRTNEEQTKEQSTRQCVLSNNFLILISIDVLKNTEVFDTE